MSGDVGLTEAERAEDRLRRHLRATTGGLGIGDLDTVVAERVREAEQRGAVQALRDAAGDETRSAFVSSAWLRARADRLAGDQ